MIQGKDPYLYPDSKVLINKFDIREKDALDQEEAAFTAFRMRELIDTPIQGDFEFQHLCAIHAYIFHDIYSWAGEIRTIDMEKPERVLAWRSVKYTV